MSTTTTPNLGNVIPSGRIRQGIYAAYVIAIVVAGALGAAFVDPDPLWLVQVGEVLKYLGIPVGTLAIVNVSSTGSATANGPSTWRGDR